MPHIWIQLLLACCIIQYITAIQYTAPSQQRNLDASACGTGDVVIDCGAKACVNGGQMTCTNANKVTVNCAALGCKGLRIKAPAGTPNKLTLNCLAANACMNIQIQSDTANAGMVINAAAQQYQKSAAGTCKCADVSTAQRQLPNCCTCVAANNDFCWDDVRAPTPQPTKNPLTAKELEAFHNTHLNSQVVHGFKKTKLQSREKFTGERYGDQSGPYDHHKHGPPKVDKDGLPVILTKKHTKTHIAQLAPKVSDSVPIGKRKEHQKYPKEHVNGGMIKGRTKNKNNPDHAKAEEWNEYNGYDGYNDEAEYDDMDVITGGSSTMLWSPWKLEFEMLTVFMMFLLCIFCCCGLGAVGLAVYAIRMKMIQQQKVQDVEVGTLSN